MCLIRLKFDLLQPAGLSIPLAEITERLIIIYLFYGSLSIPTTFRIRIYADFRRILFLARIIIGATGLKLPG